MSAYANYLHVTGGLEWVVSRADSSYLVQITDLLARMSRPLDHRVHVTGFFLERRNLCITPGCRHALVPGTFICEGYNFRQHVITAQDGDLTSRERLGNPLVSLFFCDVFCQLVEKPRCRECKEAEFGMRKVFDGVYCHGCGFFVDFTNREIGYTDEWTTTHGFAARVPLLQFDKCQRCGRLGKAAKFGDYVFCSNDCLWSWYEQKVRPRSDSRAHTS